MYYACSQSFTKHVVARLGLPAVLALFPRIPNGTWRAALDFASGKPLEETRRKWLKTLGLAPEPKDSAYDHNCRERAGINPP